MNSALTAQKVIVDTKTNTTDKKTEEQLSESEKKPKPCCACPETRRPRDQCIIEKGEENCQHLIQAHRDCMAKYGFIV